MPRTERKKSESGVYHVMARGSGGQDLFEVGDDYQTFLDLSSDAFDRMGIRLLAYCLMPNHVHLLVDDGDDGLSEAMKSLLTSYALRYNKITGHIGHVFQQRFKSCPVENDAYLLQAVRYIHNNPAKAGICPASEYWWSSYHEYVGTPKYVDTEPVMQMFGDVDEFVHYSSKSDDGYSFSSSSRMSDAEARIKAEVVLDELDPKEIKALGRSRRNALLFELKRAGLSIKQIERLTGIGRNIVARA